ncbi:MAG: tetratricopeptide repeat protein [Planctomycetota bacterium]|nr:MAG: tetratricopeptide repeat protein [Planctomycetota bacterium]REJ86479.1 MAG: tetratricopeptide repeat protein [Planctomycetota bacterium]REK28069.1 MAG: tetratricopeptide repeat protein [Planctomycetota bacterium]REK37596.1 MAG: tetratricopeptide repeat protein [Planctomycetota bacterium]
MPETTDIDELIQQARALLKQRKFAEAVQTYERAVAEHPDSIAAHEGLGTAAFITQDYDRAIKCFKHVCRLDPRRAQPLVNLGAIYNRQGDHNSAAKSLRRAIGKDRSCAEAYYNLGIAHRGLKQLPMAVSAYREAIRIAPEMAEAYQNLANVYTEMGNTQQAILNYQRALELRPDFERAKRGLEQAQQSADKVKRSISPFGRLVDISAAGEQTEGAYRKLSPQERFEDRNAVHTLAKELERAAAVLLKQVREQLDPAIDELTHAFSQSADRYNFKEEFELFQNAHRNFQTTFQNLRTRGDNLRQHEETMKE